MVDFSRLFELAVEVKKHLDEHRHLTVDVEQETDAIGTGIRVRFHAPLPPTARALAKLESAWGFTVGSCDGNLFRDEGGDFHTFSPIVDQVATLYIPYGVTRHRKAGVYTMKIEVVVVDEREDTSTAIADASVKIALPPPREWRKVEYLWPFIHLCMAVIRADRSIRPAEIRRLKEHLIGQFDLKEEDMVGLKLAMRTPPHTDIAALVRDYRRRMPYVPADDMIRLLLSVANVDGPINGREHTTVRTIAHHLGVSEAGWREVVATYRQ